MLKFKTKYVSVKENQCDSIKSARVVLLMLNKKISEEDKIKNVIIKIIFFVI